MFHFAEEFPSRITQPIQNYMHAGYNGFRPGINYTGNSISCVSELLFFCNFFLEACFYRGAPSIFFQETKSFASIERIFYEFRHYSTCRRHFLRKLRVFFSVFRFFWCFLLHKMVFCCFQLGKNSFQAFCISLRVFPGTAKMMKLQQWYSFAFFYFYSFEP